MHYNTLFKLAREVLKHSHSPYSKFAVGCAVEDEMGKAYTGTNLENANWSETICAERTAIAKMISEGGKKVRKIVVTNASDNLVFPCGSCRQVIQEFASTDCQIYVCNIDGSQRKLIAFKELFPHAFKSENIR